MTEYAIFFAALYLALAAWASWEFRQRAKQGHKCNCHVEPDAYCFYCGE